MMGKKKKVNHEQVKAVVAEFSVSMYCNACERTVAKTISKLKGVEKFTTDMINHKVVVTGKVDPQKILKKLRKTTGKRVEIVINDNKDDHREDGINGRVGGDSSHHERDLKLAVGSNSYGNPLFPDYYYCCNNSEMLVMMFSDENPNACSIM